MAGARRKEQEGRARPLSSDASGAFALLPSLSPGSAFLLRIKNNPRKMSRIGERRCNPCERSPQPSRSSCSISTMPISLEQRVDEIAWC